MQIWVRNLLIKGNRWLLLTILNCLLWRIWRFGLCPCNEHWLFSHKLHACSSCYPERLVMRKNTSTLWRKTKSHLNFFPTVFDSCAVISFKWSSVQFLVLSRSGNHSPSSESTIGTGFRVAWWWMKSMCLVLVCLLCLGFHFCGYLVFCGFFKFTNILCRASPTCCAFEYNSLT